MNKIIALYVLIALIGLLGPKYAFHLAVAANLGVIAALLVGAEVCDRIVGHKQAAAENYRNLNFIGPALVAFALVFYTSFALFEWNSPSH